MHILRLCSVFEPPDAVLHGRGVRFDPIGGMQNHTACLTRELDRRGITQDVLTTRPPGAPHRQRVGDGAVVHRFGLPVRVARQGWCLRATPAALALGARADVVHAHMGEDLAVLPMAVGTARLHDVPLVVTVHTSLRHTFTADGLRTRALKAVGGRIEDRTTRRADGVVVLTERLARRMAGGGVPVHRTHVIPSGVVPGDFAGQLVDPLPGIPRPRVLFVGRLVRQKGTDVLGALAPLLRTAGAQLVVVGDGPERPALEAAVRDAGVGHRVHVLGFRPHHEIPAIMRHADVLILPSLYEELGSVLLEGMQAALPIVAARTGGVPEAVGPAGALVRPGDAAALASTVDALLADPSAAQELGARALERAAAFDWELLAGRVAEVYDAALGREVAPLAEPVPARA